MNQTGGEAAIGIDFGTTNTVVALAGADGEARLIQFAHDNQLVAPFRSALAFHADIDNPRDRVVEAGPWAIDAYVEEPLETRFIQSFKTYAASPLFVHTNVLGRWFRFEDLLSAFLMRMLAHGGADLDSLPKRLIVGRPVNFAGHARRPAAGALPLRDRVRAAGLHRHPLRLRAGGRGVLLRAPAEARRDGDGRRLRRRHQRLLDRAVPA